MKHDILPIPENGLWPLPADYFDLGPSARIAARVNACLQYQLPASRAVQAKRFARCVDFFDRYYLWPQQEAWEGFEVDHGAGFDPGFYDVQPVEPAHWHHQMHESYWLYDQQVWVCPRGAGKSFNIRKRNLMRMLCERFSVWYSTNSNDNVIETAQRLRSQLKFNERILRDFPLLFPSADGAGAHPLVPRKGDDTFSNKRFALRNGSSMRLASVKSRQRGGRPQAYELDDPENDASSSTSMSEMRQHMEQNIFTVVMPMLLTPGATKLSWTGTFVSRTHYLWHAMTDRVLPDGGTEPADKRFRQWNRAVVRISKKVNGKDRSTWPDMWPSDEAERAERGCSPDASTLEQIREKLGPAVFAAEMEGNPGSVGAGYFDISRTSEDDRKRWGYWWDGGADVLQNPYESQAMVAWNGPNGPVSLAWKDLLTRCRPFMVVDTSATASSHADRKVVHVVLTTPDREMLSVDLWSSQCDESVLVEKVFEMADRWRCNLVWPEVVGRQQSLYRSLVSVASERLTSEMGYKHVPAVRPLKVGTERKTSKIMSLKLFFDYNRLKLPWDRQNEPAYGRLFDQLEQFNPEAPDGGLAKDDELDTLSMPLLVKKQLAVALEEEEERPHPLERLARGEKFTKEGWPVGLLLDWTQMGGLEIGRLLEAQRIEREKDAKRKKVKL